MAPQRPELGRSSATQPFGYGDGQPLALTLSDDAANGDLHSYRLTLTGDEATALSAPLTGSWQPSGRLTDPAVVGAGDARTAMLRSFTGLEVAGGWSLFVADLVEGGQFRLDSWGVEITPVTPAKRAHRFSGVERAQFDPQRTGMKGGRAGAKCCRHLAGSGGTGRLQAGTRPRIGPVALAAGPPQTRWPAARAGARTARSPGAVCPDSRGLPAGRRQHFGNASAATQASTREPR